MEDKNIRRAIHYTQQYLKNDKNSDRIHKALDLLCEELSDNIDSKQNKIY